MRRTPSPSIARATRRTRRGAAAASALSLVILGVVLAAGGLGAWWFFGRTGLPPPPANVPVGGKPFVAPTQMDAASATLARTADGATLAVTLTGVAADETLSARLRDGAGAPKSPLVFVDRGTPKSPIGVLEAKAEPTGRDGERRLSIRLPASVERVTLIDLRSSGRWEGFELEVARDR